MPTGSDLASRRSRSASQRRSGTSTGPSSGMSSPSASRRHGSDRVRPSLSMSGIEGLLEWIGTDAAVGVEEALLRPAPEAQIGGDDGFDGPDDALAREGRADDLSERGGLVGAAAQRDLVELLAFLVDAEDADMADMVVAAGIDAAGDLDLQLAHSGEAVEILERQRDALRHRNRARVGQAAIVQPRAGDDVGRQPDI